MLAIRFRAPGPPLQKRPLDIMVPGITRLIAILVAPVTRLYLIPLYILSGFAPRRPDVWVFGSWGGHRFADNGAAFFQYCARQMDGGVRRVWISRRFSIVAALREQGHEAHWIWSPRGMLSCLQAGVYVFDCFSKDINFWLSRGATKVNLWSGVPLKTFERDIDVPGSRYFRLFHGSLPERWILGLLMPWHVIRPDLLICTSPTTRPVLCSAFDVPEERVAVTGYPRIDLMVDAQSTQSDNGTPQPAPCGVFQAAGTVYLYLPTFRDSGRPYLDIDWEALDRFLASSGSKLLYKFHPMDQSNVTVATDNIVPLAHDLDVYTVLSGADVLISDFSSVIFDFLVLDRPIIYYLPDYDDFLAGSRSLNFRIEDIGVGPMCRDFEALLAAMAETRSNAAPDARQAEIRDRFHTYQDGQSSARVLDAIRRHLRSRAHSVAAIRHEA